MTDWFHFLFLCFVVRVIIHDSSAAGAYYILRNLALSITIVSSRFTTQSERCTEPMSRIPPLENVPFPQDDALPFASMSILFRTMGHRPALMQQSMQLLQTAMRGGTVDPRLKELLAVRVSQVNHCFY